MEEQQIRKYRNKLIVYESIAKNFSIASIFILCTMITSNLIPVVMMNGWQGPLSDKFTMSSCIAAIAFMILFLFLCLLFNLIFDHSKYWDKIPKEEKRKVELYNYSQLSNFQKIITKIPFIFTIIFAILTAYIGIEITKLDKSNIIHRRYEIVNKTLKIYQEYHPELKNIYSLDKQNKTYEPSYANILLDNNIEVSLDFNKTKKMIEDVEYSMTTENLTEENLGEVIDLMIDQLPIIHNDIKNLKNYLKTPNITKVNIVFTDQEKNDLIEIIKKIINKETEYESIEIPINNIPNLYCQRTFVEIDNNKITFTTSIE